MANTPDATRFQDYLNSELQRRKINAVATVVEGQDNLHYGVHVSGVVSVHFMIENAAMDGLNDTAKQIIGAHLDTLQGA
jgi:hypothetical protein